jgi:hypothetical protein
MHDDRQVEAIRRMSPAERWQMWLELSRLGMDIWEANLSPAEIDRRWTIWRREHELSHENMLRSFREADAR